LAREFGRGTPKDQKRCRVLGTISKDTQHGEESGLSLGFIDDHQSFESLQKSLGVLHESCHQRVFEVKIVEVVGGQDLSGESSFPALPWPYECDHRVTPKGALQ
jgi:hypothetical protein